MQRLRLSMLLAGVLCALALVAAGCGGDDDAGGGGGGGDEAQEGTPAGKQGGRVTFLAAGDVDYVDPGQTYYTFGYMVHYAVNRTLYSFRPDNSEEPVPDLAEGPPEISEDQRTITVRIRPGVRYAPPVDREVRSADIKYAFERAFSSNVPSGYATSFFSDIEGAPSEPGDIREIRGIETPDERTLVFRLSRPTAVTVAAAMVMPITTPVPEEYAEEFDAESPSTYDQHVAFTGPYMIRNDSEGRLVGREPGRRIEMVRNPNWDRDTDYRPAYLDAITIDEGNDDMAVATRRTLQGSGLMCCDSGQPPVAELRRAITRFPDQLGRVPGGGTRWIAMNTEEEPFDDLNVRKAVVAAFDRNALRLTRGGEEVGPIAQHYIPPGIPGFDESGGERGFREFDWMQRPRGDMELARRYMREAGYASGRYDGDERFLTIAANADPGLQTAQVAQAQFAKLGFRLNFRQVPQDTMYTRFCGRPDADVVICPNVGWFKDFQDPQPLLEPTFKGEAIKPQANVNWSQLDVPEIDRAMEEAATIPTGEERNRAWAEINKMIVAQAPAVPYVWDDSFNTSSSDVQGVTNGYYTTWDLNFSSLK